MAEPLPESELQAAVAACQQHRTKAAAARSIGIQRSTLLKRLKAAEKRGILSPASKADIEAAHNSDLLNTSNAGDDGSANPRERFDITEKSDDLSIWSVGSAVRTVADAIAKAEINLDEWEIIEKQVNSWPTAMKLTEGSRKTGDYSEQPHSQWNWQIKLKLRRRVAKRLVDALEAIHQRAKLHSPDYSKVKYPKIKPPADPHLLEISLFDVHWGKLAWREETGNDYDLKIAEQVYRNAVEDLLSRAAGYQIEEVVFPVGQDFCNIDNLKNETQAGTPQDTDSRYAKIFQKMMESLVWAIDFLIAHVPKVKVILSWGNHDKTVSYHLCRELAAWYRKCDRVDVDYKFRQRKYIEYGVNLIGLTHGNEEKHDKLPTLMATEVPELWARTKVHEWHTGHRHKSKKISFVDIDTFEGVVIRILASLSAIDAWHYSKGYVGLRAAEAFLWSREGGRVGNFFVGVRESA